MSIKKGQILNPKGRPKGSKNKFTAFKDDLIKALLLRRHELMRVEYKDLLRVWASLIPRDLTMKVKPDITYISSTPRPEVMSDISVAIEGESGTIPAQESSTVPETEPEERSQEGTASDASMLNGGNKDA